MSENTSPRTTADHRAARSWCGASGWRRCVDIVFSSEAVKVIELESMRRRGDVVCAIWHIVLRRLRSSEEIVFERAIAHTLTGQCAVANIAGFAPGAKVRRIGARLI